MEAEEVIKHYIRSDIFSDQFEWYVREIRTDGAQFVRSLTEFKLTPYEPGVMAEAAGPFMRLDSDEVQQIMDRLWECGVRPRDGSGALAHVDAVTYHLEDMRKLVFDKRDNEE